MKGGQDPRAPRPRPFSNYFLTSELQVNFRSQRNQFLLRGRLILEGVLHYQGPPHILPPFRGAVRCEVIGVGDAREGVHYRGRWEPEVRPTFQRLRWGFGEHAEIHLLKKFIFFSIWRHFKKGCVVLSTIDGYQTKTSWHPLPIKSFISTQ